MKTQIRLGIKGEWHDQDPDKTLREIYVQMNKAKISTAFVREMVPAGFEIIRLSDPYDFYRSEDEFKLAAEITQNALEAAGYEVEDLGPEPDLFSLFRR